MLLSVKTLEAWEPKAAPVSKRFLTVSAYAPTVGDPTCILPSRPEVAIPSATADSSPCGTESRLPGSLGEFPDRPGSLGEVPNRPSLP